MTIVKLVGFISDYAIRNQKTRLQGVLMKIANYHQSNIQISQTCISCMYVKRTNALQLTKKMYFKWNTLYKILTTAKGYAKCNIN